MPPDPVPHGAQTIVLLIVALPFLGSLAPLIAARLGARRTMVALLAAAPPLLSLALLARLAGRVFSDEVPAVVWPWVEPLGLALSLRIDGYAFTFALLVLAIGALIVLYARYYLPDNDRAGRFFMLLLLFMGSMLGVVTSGNLILLAIFWELTSLSSFLLIGYWHHLPAARHGARMALLVTGLGGLALLGGVILLGRIAGSFELAEVLARREVIQAHPSYLAALLLILLGAFTKSAQFPFHFWLPHAMTAPTPVSAYLHSATMVKAGVFLLGRLYVVLAGTPEWTGIVGAVGMATLLVGAWAALFQDDLKGLLAYSTISHLGLITLLFAFGTEVAAVAAVFHIINHATFKASLFMAAGIVDHEAGTRDIRVLNGLARLMPITAVLAIVAAAAMAGVPLLNGFISKEMFFAESLRVAHPEPWLWVLPFAATLAGVLSVAYSTRFIRDVFFSGAGTGMPKKPHEPPRFMRVPVEVLVVVCVAVGLAPALVVGPLLDLAAGAVLGGRLPYYSLAIWHGFNLPLLMSAVALAGGVIVYALRARICRWHARLLPPFRAERGYQRVLEALDRAAAALGSVLATGSLQRAVVLLVAVTLLAGLAPLAEHTWRSGPPAPGPLDAISVVAWALLLAAAGLTVAWHRRRYLALVAISVVGLFVALAFVRFAAPDLALTQLLVEVVTILLVLLALNFLPQQTPRETRPARRLRDALLAGAAGAGVAALTWAVLSRPAQTISGYYLEQSKPAGGGTNVVNVILVDFRGFDTLGEITVLGIAAVGIVALLAGLRSRAAGGGAGGPGAGDSAGPPAPTGGQALAPAAPRLALDRHPVILAMVARPLLPLALLVAAYLLLRGHNLPGGGFIAGLLAAIALIIQYLASGVSWTNARLRVTLLPAVPLGLAIAGLTGMVAMLFGAPFLTSTFEYFHLPVLGELELASAMAFDVGVFVTVVGVVMLILTRLGAASSGPEPPATGSEGESSPWQP